MAAIPDVHGHVGMHEDGEMTRLFFYAAIELESSRDSGSGEGGGEYGGMGAGAARICAGNEKEESHFLSSAALSARVEDLRAVLSHEECWHELTDHLERRDQVGVAEVVARAKEHSGRLDVDLAAFLEGLQRHGRVEIASVCVILRVEAELGRRLCRKLLGREDGVDATLGKIIAAFLWLWGTKSKPEATMLPTAYPSMVSLVKDVEVEEPPAWHRCCTVWTVPLIPHWKGSAIAKGGDRLLREVGGGHGRALFIASNALNVGELCRPWEGGSGGSARVLRKKLVKMGWRGAGDYLSPKEPTFVMVAATSSAMEAVLEPLQQRINALGSSLNNRVSFALTNSEGARGFDEWILGELQQRGLAAPIIELAQENLESLHDPDSLVEHHSLQDIVVGATRRMVRSGGVVFRPDSFLFKLWAALKAATVCHDDEASVVASVMEGLSQPLSPRLQHSLSLLPHKVDSVHVMASKRVARVDEAVFHLQHPPHRLEFPPAEQVDAVLQLLRDGGGLEEDGLYLYHGTCLANSRRIGNGVSLVASRGKWKSFRDGFYLTDSLQAAMLFAAVTARREGKDGGGAAVVIFRRTPELEARIADAHVFAEPDATWTATMLDCNEHCTAKVEDGDLLWTHDAFVDVERFEGIGGVEVIVAPIVKCPIVSVTDTLRLPNDSIPNEFVFRDHGGDNTTDAPLLDAAYWGMVGATRDNTEG